METGCGLSTVLFALKGCEHVCITLQQDESVRVTQYCSEQGIDTSRLKFLIGASDKILPRVVDDGPIDLMLIDGAHGFPYPMVDYHYTEHRLKIGGTLVVDDIDIPSVRVLYGFIKGELEWEETALIAKTAFFRKLQEPVRDRDFEGQRFNQSALGATSGRTSWPQRLLCKLRRLRGGIGS